MSESLLYSTSICYIKSELVHDFKLRIFPPAPADKQKTNIYLQLYDSLILLETQCTRCIKDAGIFFWAALQQCNDYL